MVDDRLCVRIWHFKNVSNAEAPFLGEHNDLVLRRYLEMPLDEERRGVKGIRGRQ